MTQEQVKKALVLMAEFIAEGLIIEVDKNRYTLTDKGRIAANAALAKLTFKEQGLALLLSDYVIRKEATNK